MTRTYRVPAARVGAGFAAFGAYWATLTIAAPAIKSDFGLDDAGLGAVLASVLALGAFFLPVAARIADRDGPWRIMRVGIFAMGLAAIGSALAPNLVTFTATMAAAGICAGLLEIGINAGGIQAELDAHRPVLGWLHAAFNGMSLLWGLALALLVASGTGRLGLFLASGVATIALMFATPPFRSDPPERPHGPDAHERRGVIALVRERPRLVPLAAVCAFAFVAEGAVGTWSFLYLSRDLHAPAVISGLGYALFEFTMLLGRIVLPRFQARLGNRALFLAFGTALVGAGIVALATTSVTLTLIGFFLCGLAIAPMVPLTMTVASELAPDQPANATAAITFVGYLALVAGPFVIGTLADMFSLRAALAILLPLGAGVAGCAAGVQAGRVGPVEVPAVASGDQLGGGNT